MVIKPPNFNSWPPYKKKLSKKRKYKNSKIKNVREKSKI